MTQEPTTDLANTGLPSLGPIVTIAVGNSRTQVGSFTDLECLNPQSFDSSDAEAISLRVGEIVDSWKGSGHDDPKVVIAGVHPAHGDEIERMVRMNTGVSTSRFGRDFHIPIEHTLTESGEMTVGQDRLLCALGAFEMLNQACVVIDVGTAVTIDFVDGTGVFHGGAIMPGLSMMLDSLHDSTSSLPRVVYSKLDAKSNEPGKQTDHAIILGVSYAIRGAVRALTERYAIHYEAYPKTIVTGGDIGLLEDDELIDSFVPDLQLRGIRNACAKLIALDDEDIE
ncbi:MAG: type III pantothenate kinase [Phycisphaerales bacterium]